MKQAEGLPSPVVHRHRGDDTGRRELQYLDTKGVGKAASRKRAKPREPVDLFGHGENYTDRRFTMFATRIGCHATANLP